MDMCPTKNFKKKAQNFLTDQRYTFKYHHRLDFKMVSAQSTGWISLSAKIVFGLKRGQSELRWYDWTNSLIFFLAYKKHVVLQLVVFTRFSKR